MGLVGFVHVSDEHFDVHSFGPNDKVPEWAARKMGTHCFADGAHPFQDEPETQGEQADVPARSGPKSSAEAWHAYAAAKGVVVDSAAKRDDVIVALEAAGVPTE